MTGAQSLHAWLSACAVGLLAACSASEAPLQVVRLRQTTPLPVRSAADGMNAARFRHSATLLLDGKLLLVGGATRAGEHGPGLGAEPTASAELFDPVSGLFEDVGALAQARWGHTATLLHDGQVLVAGGVDEGDDALASTEVYDPDTKGFREAGSMHQARALHTATLLADDRVLILGGVDNLTPGAPRPSYPYVYEALVAHAEAYRPQQDGFDDLGDVAGAAFPHAAALLDDGRVAIAWPAPGTVSLALFDPESDQFTLEGEVPCSLPCQDVLLRYDRAPDGLVLGVITAAEEIRFDRASATVTRVNHGAGLFDESGSGSSAAMAFGSALGANYTDKTNFGSQPMLAGGWWGDGSSARDALRAGWLAEPNWIDAGQLTAPRAWPTVTSLPSGDILVTGGMADTPLATVEELSVAGQRVSIGRLAQAAGVMITPLANLGEAIAEGHAATLLTDGRVLFTGGYLGSKEARAWTVRRGSSVDMSENLNVPEPVGTILAERARHGSFLLPSGQVLLAGGETRPDDANEELFDPVSGSSRDLGFRLQARHMGLAVGGNRFLFASQAGLELVDATDFTVQRIEPPAPLGCEWPSLARLLNGRVAVLGQSFLFELDLQQAKATPPVDLQTPRCHTAVTALPDGRLAIEGGSADGQAGVALFEAYDPATRRLSAAGQLLNPVSAARAVVRFSNLFLLGGFGDTCPPQVVEWSSGLGSSVFTDQVVTQVPSVTTLADGGILIASLVEAPPPGLIDRPQRVDLMTTDSTDLQLDAQPLEVKPGRDVELTDLHLSRTWPENSGGVSQGSATNTPIAIWIPLLDGWPVTGTFVAWSEAHATWRVPSPAFPGLGILGYVLSGVLHPLRLVRISELDEGEACEQSSQCASSYCVDGVCCDRACDSACEACAAALKGEGDDGACGPTAADQEEKDPACDEEDSAACGRTGYCDGAGECAIHVDGDRCADGAVCNGGFCAPKSASSCDGDHTVTSGDDESTCENNLRCSVATGKCLDECTTNIDCVDGFSCGTTGECQEPFARPNTSIGCAPGCRAVSRESQTPASWSVGLALAVAAARRRQRRRLAG